MADPTPAVGIDLGTTYSVVGVFRNRRVEIVGNETGTRTTPSYVAYTEDGCFVGNAAKDLASGSNTLYDSKRLIGRRYEEVEEKKDVCKWPFRVMNDGGLPKYEITDENARTITISPEEVSAKILELMKKDAEERCLEVKIGKAVVTVPAYFSASQCAATVSAAKLAGLEVDVLKEPSAAAIAYAHGKGKTANILIFDLGGGTFDLSVVKVKNDDFDVIAYEGDTHLGGQDFDHLLMEFLKKDIQDAHDFDISEDPEALHELKKSCEVAKRQLSTAPQAKVVTFLNRINEGYSRKISRAQFEELCLPKFKMAVAMLPTLLEKAKMAKEDIDEVVLVGGSTRIPRVQALVKEFFNGKELNKSINPDEAVAYGAAIYAGRQTNKPGATELRLKEMASLSLGVATSDGIVAWIIREGANLPAKCTKTFTTTRDGQEAVEIKVYQGLRVKHDDNHMIGYVTLSIPAKPKGEIDILVSFELSANGVLNVTALEKSSGEKVESILECEANLSEKEIQDLIHKAKQFKLEDEAALETARRERFRL